MAKIKSVSNYNGASWDTPIPLGADDANIDITSATTDPTTDTTATAAGLIAADVVAGEGDTDATAWTKFNKFRRRVYNAFNGVAGVAVATSAVSSGGNSKVYSAGYINNYMTNVVGHSGTTTPTNGTIMDQLNTTNQNLNNRVAKAGDTMTGNLLISRNGTSSDVALKRTDVTLGTAPSADTLLGSVMFYDSANNNTGYVGNLYKTNKYSVARLLARNWNGSTNYSNYVDLLSGEDGSAAISFSHPAAWRSAIGAVNKAGDTMTGNLTIQKNNASFLYLKSPVADGSASTSSTDMYETVGFTDKNDALIGFIQSVLNANGNSRLSFGARRKVNGADATNSFEIAITNNGSPLVSMTHPDAWRYGLGYRAGETVAFSGARVMGRVVSAGNAAYVALALPFSITANNVSVTLTSANVFCVSGSTSASNLTVSNVGMNKNLGQITFTIPIAQTFTGMTVCMAEIAGSVRFS